MLLLLPLWPRVVDGQPGPGACSVTASPAWKTEVSFDDDPFRQSSEGLPHWIKFTILRCDPTVVYFQDSRESPFHYDFATRYLDPFSGWSREQFDAATLHAVGQEAVLGAVLFPGHLGPARPLEFGIQLVRADPYSLEDVIDLFRLVESKVVAPEGTTSLYFPTYEQSRSAIEQREELHAAGVEVASPDRWANDSFVYSEGWALGVLKFFPAAEIEGAYVRGDLEAADILVTDLVPAELPFVAGIVSLEASTPNSHVAILAKNFGVPFVHPTSSRDEEKLLGLLGRRVVLSAYDDPARPDFRLFDVEDQLDPQTIAEILELKSLPPLGITPKESAGRIAVPVRGLSLADARFVGGKAANYSLLLAAIPENTRVAMALTFDLWDEFLDQSMPGGETLREAIDERLAPHGAYPPENLPQLVADLDQVRDWIRDDEITSFSSVLRAGVLDALADPQFGFDPAQNIRFRSSSNFEDSEVYTAAGLFDSRSGCVLDDTDGDDMGPSHCDLSEPDERGVFRAIRRVYASFFTENAFLERRRWGVDEGTVGMAILVHHSFPDNTELANGVATLRRTAPNYVIQMVTQTGATSVTNPEDGSRPEVVDILAFGSGGRAVQLVEESNLVPLGTRVLEWTREYESFASLFVDVAQAFEARTGKTSYTLEFEFKKIAPGDQLVVKQVRQLPKPTSGDSVTPFLLNVPTEFETFQGEASDVFANLRLKSDWRLETRSMWLTEENLAAGVFDRVRVDYSDGCSILRFDDAAASLPGVEEVWGEDQSARLRWRFDHLPNPRDYELSTSALRLSVASSESPFVTLEDLALQVDVRHRDPVLGWNSSTEVLEERLEEGVRLAVAPQPESSGLPQERSVAHDGVRIMTRFFWPLPPSGIVAGYTAPLLRWTETTIEGLTSEPIRLTGARSQTYRPEHHNLGERFLFEPHLEEGISDEVLAELDAMDVRWIRMEFGLSPEPIQLYSACDGKIACACPGSLPTFRRGECNGDDRVDISDAVCFLEWLFLGGDVPGCVASGNVNGDVAVDISDAIGLLGYLFLGGAPPVAPHPECGDGVLPSDVEMGCLDPSVDCRGGGI